MNLSLPSRRLLGLAVLLAALVAATLVALGAGGAGGARLDGARAQTRGSGCPRGLLREREPGSGDRGECARVGRPESRAEVLAFNAAQARRATAPFTHLRPGAEAAAVRQAQALRASAGAHAAGAGGTWTPLGTEPLDAGDTSYDQTNGATQEGFKYVSGRVQHIAYDRTHARTFAAPVNGGVWQSDTDGASWRSIGDGLPTQVVGAVEYTPANGGTILALTGDPAFGGSSSAGLGLYRTTNDGATWTRAAGIPSGVLGFDLAVDPTNPNRIYAATGAGLFRSTDGGASFVNVMLPTGTCAGHTLDYTQSAYKDCFLANEVTDVVVQGPANAKTPNAQPGAVMAAVGWRAGQKLNADVTQQSPNNGIYTSPSGAPGSFTKIDTSASGFAGGSQGSIGRVALGIANGQASTSGEADQNHNVVYALVEDANKFNGKKVPDSLDNVTTGTPGSTVLLGVYVSSDFGKTWTLMENANGAPPSLYGFDTDPTSGSALEPAGAGLSYQPGVQAWYNEWVAPDPTLASSTGVPLRVALGLEEIWENDFPAGTGPSTPQDGPSRFRVIGRYWNSCDFEANGLPKCSPSTGPDATTPNTTTTHPDQHAGLFVPDGKGGVTLFAGNDGGVYSQHVDSGADFSNNNWGNGDQGSGPNHLHTLQPYDVEMAKDGTAYMGLQDNGEAKIQNDGIQKGIFGGDGFFTAVDPNNADVAYEEYTYGVMQVTQDGGHTWKYMDPQLTSALFATPFKMDPLDAKHILTGGRQVMETLLGPDTWQCPDPSCSTVGNDYWTQVYDLGTQQHPGDASASSSATDPNNQTSADDVYGDDAYVGFCGFCDVLTQSVPFKRGLATNVDGAQDPKKGTSQGWHIAAAKGLPNRIITGIAIDPKNPETVFVSLAGYGRKWAPPGAAGDDLSQVGTGHVFRSTDAGQHFTDISGELPDAPADTILLDGNQVIVGTEVGVFISSDRDGSAWAPLGSGLPNVPVNHLAFKAGDPSTATVVAATYGRGAYSIRLVNVAGAPFGGGSARACAATTVFRSVRASGRGVTLRLGFRAPARTRATIDVFQSSQGRQVLGQRLVAHFRTRRTSFTWNGRANVRGRRVTDGYFFVRYSATRGGKHDVRRITLRRANGRFAARPPFYRRASCGLLSSYKLQAPVFGGPRNAAAFASYRLSRPGTVSVVVLRGRKVIRRFGGGGRKAGRTYRLRLAAEHLPRGDYAFRITVRQGAQQVTSTLVTRRL